ncbi:MAG: yhjA [Flavipsychrobacter sp.]|nr:yhjA [Flavipsychrobacter sp.]
MRNNQVVCFCLVLIAVFFISFKNGNSPAYWDKYHNGLKLFKEQEINLLNDIHHANLKDAKDIEKIKGDIIQARNAMKAMDLWFRYLQPLAYKRINAPLPVEWETEVFEKFEQPYKRTGAGLALATLYLDEADVQQDSLEHLISSSLSATAIFAADSVTKELNTYHHFFLCNRLFLLNLAAVYTTGFECPDAKRIIPELKIMLAAVNDINAAFNESFPATPLPANYCSLYRDMVLFVNSQPEDHTAFDHYTFLRNYVNPLFVMNQQLITQYKVVSHSLVDYSLNKKATSIFDKHLYNGQNDKGVFIRVQDSTALAQIEHVGKLLFYDPILSGNNMRSCVSCHKPTEFFTDTTFTTSLNYNRKDLLSRNSPSLVNSVYNHLVMLDGKHISLQNQTKAVIANEQEMGCNEKEVMTKVLSCNEYKQAFQQLLKYTPAEQEISYDHIVSTITYYYSKFSGYYAPFDDAMNNGGDLNTAAKSGFNIFMGKAQCATCHFVPQFNGVKPPYVSSEFEVLGVPVDTAYTGIGTDEGRYTINPAKETRNAFRTGTVRNAAHTKPYMHNGVFRSLEQVIDFYDGGGGAGRGLKISNQTLSADSLKLTVKEKSDLVAFISSLDEHVIFEAAPASLPKSKIKALNERKPGGVY